MKIRAWLPAIGYFTLALAVLIALGTLTFNWFQTSGWIAPVIVISAILLNGYISGSKGRWRNQVDRSDQPPNQADQKPPSM